jgi:ABC-type transport system substrate-binding protein
MRLLTHLTSIAIALLIVTGCSASSAPPPASAPTAAPKPTSAPAPTTAPASTTSAAAVANPTAPAAPPTAAPAAKPTTAPAVTNLTGTLKIDTISEIESPHPFFASQLVGISARQNMFDSLIDREYDGKIVPALAESWNVVDDQTIDFKFARVFVSTTARR